MVERERVRRRHRVRRERRVFFLRRKVGERTEERMATPEQKIVTAGLGLTPCFVCVGAVAQRLYLLLSLRAVCRRSPLSTTLLALLRAHCPLHVLVLPPFLFVPREKRGFPPCPLLSSTRRRVLLSSTKRLRTKCRFLSKSEESRRENEYKQRAVRSQVRRKRARETGGALRRQRPLAGTPETWSRGGGGVDETSCLVDAPPPLDHVSGAPVSGLPSACTPFPSSCLRSTREKGFSFLSAWHYSAAPTTGCC